VARPTFPRRPSQPAREQGNRPPVSIADSNGYQIFTLSSGGSQCPSPSLTPKAS
jgi:hypothetical protein